MYHSNIDQAGSSHDVLDDQGALHVVGVEVLEEVEENLGEVN